MGRWVITYEDGDEIQEETVSGKLTLNPGWVFVVAERPTPSVVFAVPAHRVIDVREYQGA